MAHNSLVISKMKILKKDFIEKLSDILSPESVIRFCPFGGGNSEKSWSESTNK